MTEKKETKKTVAKKTAAKTTTKKVAPKKTAPKKEESKKDTPKKTPARAKRAEIDRNELIPCRSVTTGTLIHISDRTRARYVWSDFGTRQYIEMGELLDMRASHPKFLSDVQMIVEDEEAVDILGLVHKYETLGDFDTLDDFFEKSADELAEILPNLPKGIKQSLGNRARHLVEEGELDRLGIIRVFEEALNIELRMFTD